MVRALWDAWVIIARKIGQFQSKIVLTLFYFVFLAPFAVAARCFSDPLNLRSLPAWRPLPHGDGPTDSLTAARQQY